MGCLLLNKVEPGTMQLRAMAVATDWQGRKIGQRLVTAAEKFCVESGAVKVMLHARKVAVGFYASMGYQIVSDEFIEVGIPHYLMEKALPRQEAHT